MKKSKTFSFKRERSINPASPLITAGPDSVLESLCLEQCYEIRQVFANQHKPQNSVHKPISVRTTRNLHSHLHEAPLTKKHLQVTGYGIVSIIVFMCLLNLIKMANIVNIGLCNLPFAEMQVTSCFQLLTPLAWFALIDVWVVSNGPLINLTVSFFRMVQGIPMISGRWRCVGGRKATRWKCCAVKCASCIAPLAVCSIPRERCSQSGKNLTKCSDSPLDLQRFIYTFGVNKLSLLCVLYRVYEGFLIGRQSVDQDNKKKAVCL